MTMEILTYILGGGFLALIIGIVTLGAKIKEANAKAEQAVADAQKMKAEAKSQELTNVEHAIKIWRELATDLAQKYAEQTEAYSALNKNYTELTHKFDALNKEVKRLSTTSNKILTILDKMTPDNLESTKQEIRNELQK